MVSNKTWCMCVCVCDYNEHIISIFKMEATYFKKHPNNSFELEVLFQQNLVIRKRKGGQKRERK